MNQSAVISRFAQILGVFLLIEGIWELFSPVVFGVLSGNVTHGIIHIVLGVLGLWTGTRGGARGFCIFIGLLLLVVGALWFVPSGHELIVRLLNVNQAVTFLNLIVGAIALLLGLFAARPARA